MKKPMSFALALLAAGVMLTGCATKEEVAAQRAAQQAAEVVIHQDDEMADAVSAEPAPSPVVTPQDADVPAETAGQPAKPAPVHPQPEVYIASAGDSVSALAKRFNVRQPDILALNPALRANPNKMEIGQKVLLPPGTDVAKKPIPRAPAPEAPAGGSVYTVKSGDVLGGIAAKHGVTVPAIKEANRLTSDNIRVGQKLRIPAGGKKPAAKAAAAKPKAETSAAKPKPQQLAKVEVPPEPAPAVTEDVPPPPPEVTTPVQQGEEALPPPPPEPEAVETPAVTQQAKVEDRLYVVKDGEDLVAISLYWGVTLPALRAANNIDESAGNSVAPGTTLRIPAARSF